MFAQNYMKKYNENFPDFLFKLQQTNLQNNYKPYLFIHLPLSPSNIKYLHSLGYDYIHFDPHYPFNFEQMKKIYKLGIMACGSVAYNLAMYQDFYVIYPSELYIKRANNAANTIVTCWKKYYTNKNEFKDCQFSQPSPKKHVKCCDECYSDDFESDNEHTDLGDNFCFEGNPPQFPIPACDVPAPPASDSESTSDSGWGSDNLDKNLLKRLSKSKSLNDIPNLPTKNNDVLSIKSDGGTVNNVQDFKNISTHLYGQDSSSEDETQNDSSNSKTSGNKKEPEKKKWLWY